MKFRDSKGREHDCLVTLSTSIAFKKLGVDLMGHFDGKLWEQLANDPELLVNVLAESIKDSMIAHNIDAVELARSLGGDTLEKATIALREAIADFSPPLQRAAMKKLIEKADQVQAIATGRIMKELDSLDPQTILNSLNLSGDKPESSVSLPASSTKSVSAN